MIHLLGFSGSALIILSITMGSVVRLRLIGLAGAATFVTYGLLLGAWPIVVTNVITSSIHVYYLRQPLEPGLTITTAEPAPGSPFEPVGRNQIARVQGAEDRVELAR